MLVFIYNNTHTTLTKNTSMYITLEKVQRASKVMSVYLHPHTQLRSLGIQNAFFFSYISFHNSVIIYCILEMKSQHHLET